MLRLLVCYGCWLDPKISGGLLDRRLALDHAHDVGFLHDEVLGGGSHRDAGRR
jgi:hypothetical protein